MSPEVIASVAPELAARIVADSRDRQAVTAAGEGCRAAIEAMHYLESLGA